MTFLSLAPVKMNNTPCKPSGTVPCTQQHSGAASISINSLPHPFAGEGVFPQRGAGSGVKIPADASLSRGKRRSHPAARTARRFSAGSHVKGLAEAVWGCGGRTRASGGIVCKKQRCPRSPKEGALEQGPAPSAPLASFLGNYNKGGKGMQGQRPGAGLVFS